jgi:hypothetical protein
MDKYLPNLPTISKPALKNSAYLKMYQSKGERGADRESVFHVGDNFTFTKQKKIKKKDNFFTCHRPVSPFGLLETG